MFESVAEIKAIQVRAETVDQGRPPGCPAKEGACPEKKPPASGVGAYGAGDMPITYCTDTVTGNELAVDTTIRQTTPGYSLTVTAVIHKNTAMAPPNVSSFSGGSLLLAWQLKDKRVLIVGGGEVASGRIESVLVADALITVISPRAGLHPLTKKYIEESPRITYHDRAFAGPQDLDGVDMVLTAIDNVENSRGICALCRVMKIPVNVADIPPSCDFYFGSQIRSGPLQVMISTNGQSPKLANIIRRKIEQALPEHAGEAVEKVGELRTKLRDRAPGVGGELGKRRMRWMVDVCNAWDIEDLAALDEEMMLKLLDDGWEKNKVPKPAEVGFDKEKYAASKAITSSSYALSDAVLPSALGFLAGIAATAVVLMAHSRR